MKIRILLFLFLLTGLASFAQSDTLKLKNGNILVGEIKKMDKGVLTMETPYSDNDFTITWSEVVFIKSESNFIIMITSGKRLSSSLFSDPTKPSVILTNSNEFGEREFRINQIVYIESFEDDIKSRFSANFDIGSTLTKANNLKQITVSAKVSYMADKWSSSANLNLVESTQDSVSDIVRNQAGIEANYFLPADFFLNVRADFLRNDELQLKLRSTYKAGLGYYVIRTNRLYWSTLAGISSNNEEYIDPTIDTRNSGEAFIATEVNLFSFGDIDMLTNFALYPSLTESGRLRYDFNFDLKYDLPYDFYIKMGMQLNYDNQPAEGVDQYDYVLLTGVGWEL